MKKVIAVRKDNMIINVETNEKRRYKFTNEAKRASRKIQMDTDGALGRGSVVLR